ncbi:tetratricopeptide repeat protein [Pseudoduganella rhizocola]|uniref:tetratricopeptide repeat protein n=1 Tax=Pseudoduganella rhizocola TaxID=3382643 RepID=UPI0038B45992
MLNQPDRTTRPLIALLCLLWAAGVHPASLPPGLADDGKARLNDLLNENLDYIRNQGGPYTDPQRALREFGGFFEAPPCPHCEPLKSPTEEEEARISDAIRAEAENGDPKAQFRLAGRYAEGKGMDSDIVQGLHWLQRAAGNGNRDASFALARIYDSGIGVPADHAKAAHFYETVADSRVHAAIANRRLGEMNEFGIGIPQDYAKAMARYHTEIALNADSMRPVRWSQWSEFAIGRMYAQGKGVPQDYAKAAEWFLTVTDRGASYGGLIPEAECALAIMYWTGLGVQRNETRGTFFLHRPNAMSMKACKKLKADLSSQ